MKTEPKAAWQDPDVRSLETPIIAVGTTSTYDEGYHGTGSTLGSYS